MHLVAGAGVALGVDVTSAHLWALAIAGAADEEGPAMRVSSQGVTVVALLADPDAPTEIAQRLAQTLPTRLADKSGQGRRFEVEVVSEPFTSGSEDPPTLMRRIMDRSSAENWDIVVALTDLPLHSHGHKLVVHLSHKRGLALLSLPSLGGLRLQTRARRAVEEAVLGLADPRATGAEGPRLGPFAGHLTPVHPGPVGEEETPDLRYVVSGARGYLRVLFGMVRANRPWRLVPGLSRALAAALATGAIATVNSTVWNLSGALSAPRLVIAMVGSIALMIGWLIVDAQLWHRSAEGSPEARRTARLYNASTVVTVGIGVLVCYAGLMVINLVWALFILNDRVFASMTRTPLHAAEYVTLSWFVASVATVGGALGSGLESDEAIRAAAYSKREQERRLTLQDDHGDQPS
ncbi:hypothetical protein P1P75_04705 [Streptomyces sp. ID05-39B]|uniref:hypothetical protein n=1 Tax=Streptomyces sp. ID05-39B TaxID=3028664 RepID=UPI0029A17960|nr:hypothetical protein [Streptomyces sp. ID05-39B]MDX3525752.1 hypothetical protein [Streptomyces sp. ID05-39B]